ncbi:hypothetical protein AAE478_000711 [Parahypoxylon ruwenzoriense]
MADSNRFRVPAGSRHSFGIELEFIVAWLPPEYKDPHEKDAHLLPPLLRMDGSGFDTTIEILTHIRETFRKHGVAVNTPRTIEASASSDVPTRLRNRDRWDIGLDSSVEEPRIRDYSWQGIEVTSPAMWATKESFDEVRYVINLLKSRYRLRINPTTGFHVHVANGKNFFTADMIKRMGAFLWAADPLLSRLHPPWRRIHEYSHSLRYKSAVSCLNLDARRAQAAVDQLTATHGEEFDPIRVTEWSDTSREELEHGGKEGWEEYARRRGEVGPFMVVSENLDDGGYVEGNDEGRGKDNNDGHDNGDGGSGGDSEDSNLARQEEDDGILDDLSPEDHSQHGKVEWIRLDELEDIATLEALFRICQDRYGHEDIYELTGPEQIDVLLTAHCDVLFGHTNFSALSKDEKYQILVASSPYIEVDRSTGELDAAVKALVLGDHESGSELRHPAADREIKIDAPRTIRKFENLAKLLELDGEHSELGIEYVGRAEYDEATKTTRGIEKLLRDLRDYAESPGPQDEQQDLDEQEEDVGPRNPESQASSPFNPSPQDRSPAPRRTKLRPHNLSDLPVRYKAELGRYSKGIRRLWDRIPWVPSEHSRKDPGERHRFGDESARCSPEECPDHARASIWEGLAQIGACETAAAVGRLMHGVEGHRLNYNFYFYTPDALTEHEVGTTDPDNPNPRTIEFREGAGTLDGPWVATWARICAGIADWCRRARVDDFLAVLDRIARQEDKDQAALAARKAGVEVEDYPDEEYYDVCDLLEDIGLFAEAAWVRRRERESGPPR